ncbi:hypothetical protein [Leifsonia kafniensis]
MRVYREERVAGVIQRNRQLVKELTQIVLDRVFRQQDKNHTAFPATKRARVQMGLIAQT